MNKVTKRPLGEVAEIIMGQSPESESYNEKGDGIPFYQGKSDFGEVYPTIRMYCNSPKKIAEADDILMSVRAPIGDVNIAQEECCIGRGLAAIRPNHKVHLKYLFYLLDYYKERLDAQGTGSTFKAIGKDILNEFVIPIWETEIQQDIVAKLNAIHNLIDNRKQVLSTLDTLIKSRFIEMFGDPVTNPHGWDKVPLSDLAEIKIGPFGTLLHKEDYITGGHALVNPSHIHDGNIVTDGKLTITDEKYAELSAYHLSENDVVMGRRGEMGRCAVVKESGLLCGTGSMIIRSYGEVRADFLQKIISFPSFKKTIEDMAVGQTMPNLNVPIVSRLEIIKPPTKVQDDYYAFVELTDKSKFAVQQSIDTLQTLKAKLMQDYFG